MGFAEIFTNMDIIPAVLLSVGLIFMLVEVFVPGFGFFGVTGTLSLIAGVIVRICQGLNVTQSIMLILLILGVFFVAGMYMTFSARYGLLSKTGLFENKSSISANYNKVPKELRKLVGKSGKTVTDLKLGGKAKIRGKIYDVMSINSFIEANKNIKVVYIRDNTIMVRKWFE